MDKTDLMEYFLDFSVAATGFSRFELEGTGQAPLYFETVLQQTGEEILGELLQTFHELVRSAEKEYKPGIFTEGLQSKIMASGKLGPIARNIIKLWYIATWDALPSEWQKWYATSQEEAREEEAPFIPSPQAYPEGLVWKAVGVNPPGAKPQGYGTWSDPPSVSLS
ncbi:MAG: hypothetical protein SXA11_21170 [Cyanobacteriota bacterium]|nr:hypothetical protein [Cyanobacteriota bacterium]